MNFREKIIDNVAKNPTVPLKKLYVEELQESDQRFLAPNYDTIRRTMQRKRTKNLPKSPKIFEDIKLEGSWTMTLNRQDFLLYQGQGMLIFGIKQGLDFLVRSQKILCDETFKKNLQKFGPKNATK